MTRLVLCPGRQPIRCVRIKKKCLKVYGTVKDAENTARRKSFNKSDVKMQVIKSSFTTHNDVVSARFVRLSENTHLSVRGQNVLLKGKCNPKNF